MSTEKGSWGQLVIAFLTVPWWGYVMSKHWNWFLVPLGAPHITLWHAFGLAMTLTFATYRPLYLAKVSQFGVESTTQTWAEVLAPALSLFFGWLLHFGVKLPA